MTLFVYYSKSEHNQTSSRYRQSASATSLTWLGTGSEQQVNQKSYVYFVFSIKSVIKLKLKQDYHF